MPISLRRFGAVPEDPESLNSYLNETFTLIQTLLDQVVYGETDEELRQPEVFGDIRSGTIKYFPATSVTPNGYDPGAGEGFYYWRTTGGPGWQFIA